MAEKKIKRPKLPQSRGGNQSGKAPQRQRLTRRPLFWILVAIIAVTVFGQISSGSNQFTKIETSQAMAAITKGEVESANIVDCEQVIQLVLKPGQAINGSTKVEASYISGQEPILVDLLTANQSQSQRPTSSFRFFSHSAQLFCSPFYFCFSWDKLKVDHEYFPSAVREQNFITMKYHKSLSQMSRELMKRLKNFERLRTS
jgi:ATP-dependent Zn protease